LFFFNDSSPYNIRGYDVSPTSSNPLTAPIESSVPLHVADGASDKNTENMMDKNSKTMVKNDGLLKLW
jgi:hypothetical protein